MQADFNLPVLAIDTSTSFLSLALRANGKTLVRHNEVGNRQSELILPQTGELFAESGIGAADLGAIVYAQGPGAFTGLRIGIGVAQGLAAPFATPLIGVPCLDAAAYRLPGRPCVLAATDARMGEVFYAWFDTAAHRRLSSYRVQTAAAMLSRWPTNRLLRAVRRCRPPPTIWIWRRQAVIPPRMQRRRRCFMCATKSP